MIVSRENKSVQRQYYLLSCRFLLFTGKRRKMKREVFSDLNTEATASAKMITQTRTLKVNKPTVESSRAIYCIAQLLAQVYETRRFW